MHSDSTGCRGSDLNAYLASKRLAVASRRTSHRYVFLREVWYQSAQPEGLEDSAGLGGKSEPL